MAPTPHDTLFRSVFGLPQHAAAELGAVLPRELVELLDLAELRRGEGSFIDDALHASSSDLLFRAPWRTGRNGPEARDGLEGLALAHARIDPFLYLILEHQGTFDPRMPLRLLGYLTRIWERHRREHPTELLLPPIVPLVIHHGAKPWRGPTRFGQQLLLPAGFAPPVSLLLLDFGFLLDDLTLCTDAELLARGDDAMARLTLLALRNGRDRDDSFPRLVAAIRALWKDLRDPAAPSALTALVSHVRHVDDAPLAQVRDTIAAALTD